MRSRDRSQPSRLVRSRSVTNAMQGPGAVAERRLGGTPSCRRRCTGTARTDHVRKPGQVDQFRVAVEERVLAAPAYSRSGSRKLVLHRARTSRGGDASDVPAWPTRSGRAPSRTAYSNRTASAATPGARPKPGLRSSIETVAIAVGIGTEAIPKVRSVSGSASDHGSLSGARLANRHPANALAMRYRQRNWFVVEPGEQRLVRSSVVRRSSARASGWRKWVNTALSRGLLCRRIGATNFPG